MTDFKLVQKEWMEKNPLRSFRKASEISIFSCASAIGVTTSSVQGWESGTAMPTEENMDKIARLVGNPKVAVDWKEWSEARPKLE